MIQIFAIEPPNNSTIGIYVAAIMMDAPPTDFFFNSEESYRKIRMLRVSVVSHHDISLDMNNTELVENPAHVA